MQSALAMSCWAAVFTAFSVMLPTGVLSATKSARSIPDDNLSYPISIQQNKCTTPSGVSGGSGFFLNDEKGTYLVTARHILFNESVNTRPLLCKDAAILAYGKDQAPNRLGLDLESLGKAGKIKAHQTHDVAVVQVGTASMKQEIAIIPGVQILQAGTGIVGVGLENVRRFSEILIANEIYVFGYPTSVGLPKQAQLDYTRPLIRKGIIAGTNETNRTIILDALIYQGNSGGPVLQVEAETFARRFNVVGVITQWVPIAETWVNANFNYSNQQLYNSGYSVAVPMDMVLELIGSF